MNSRSIKDNLPFLSHNSFATRRLMLHNHMCYAEKWALSWKIDERASLAGNAQVSTVDIG